MTTTTSGYKPIRNDRADFDPMSDQWSYVVDDAGAEWRQLVAKSQRRATWPFRKESQHGYHYVRLSPDWAFYAWGSEYVGADWSPERPSLVDARLTITRRVERDGRFRLDDYTGIMTLDLAAQSFAWDCPRQIPADVLAEAEHKARKLLGFFATQNEAWREESTPRPVTAADLYKQAHAPDRG